MRALSSSLYKDTAFFAEIQIALTFEYIFEMLKCSDLQQRRLARCYITRRDWMDGDAVRDGAEWPMKECP